MFITNYENKIYFFILFFLNITSHMVFAADKDINQIQPDTEEYDSLCEAARTDVWCRIYNEKRKKFVRLVQFASEIILRMDNMFIGDPPQKEWKQIFKSTQMTWLKLVELERIEYCYNEDAQGFNSYRDSIRSAIEKINQRIQKIKKRWYLKNIGANRDGQRGTQRGTFLKY